GVGLLANAVGFFLRPFLGLLACLLLGLEPLLGLLARFALGLDLGLRLLLGLDLGFRRLERRIARCLDLRLVGGGFSLQRVRRLRGGLGGLLRFGSGLGLGFGLVLGFLLRLGAQLRFHLGARLRLGFLLQALAFGLSLGFRLLARLAKRRLRRRR